MLIRSSSQNIQSVSKGQTQVTGSIAKISQFGKSSQTSNQNKNTVHSMTDKDLQQASHASNSRVEQSPSFVKSRWARTPDVKDNNSTSGLQEKAQGLDSTLSSKDASSLIAQRKVQTLGQFIFGGQSQSKQGSRQAVRSTNQSKIEQSGDNQTTPLIIHKSISNMTTGSDSHHIIDGNPARPYINKNSSLSSLKMSRGRSESREGPVLSDTSGPESSKHNRSVSNLNRSMEVMVAFSQQQVKTSHRSIPDAEDGSLYNELGRSVDNIHESTSRSLHGEGRRPAISKELLKTPFIVKKKHKTARLY